MLESPINPQDRDVLVKLASGDYILKFGQLYRVELATLFPSGPQLGMPVMERLLNQGLIEKVMVDINGVSLKCHMISKYGRRRLEGK